MTLRHLMLAAALTASTAALHAATIIANLPEFNGSFNSTGPYPLAPVTVGTFNYTIPNGDIIVSATITGSFGDSQFPDSAGVNLTAGGVQFVSCVENTPCDTGTSITPFSFNFDPSAFGALAGGTLTETAVQTGGNVIRLGAETLTITTVSGTPEPASLCLIGLGLAGLGVARRWRKR